MTFGEQATVLAGQAASLLGWRPAEFWNATPAELASSLGLDTLPAEAMPRDLFEQLVEQFPDDRKS